LAETEPAPDSVTGSLTPEEFGRLFDAFLEAFYSKAHLERVVAFSFSGVDLADVTSEGSLRTVTAELIRWAVAHDALSQLIAGARKENEGNTKLKEFEVYWRNRPTRKLDQVQQIRDDVPAEPPDPSTVPQIPDKVSTELPVPSPAQLIRDGVATEPPVPVSVPQPTAPSKPTKKSGAIRVGVGVGVTVGLVVAVWWLFFRPQGVPTPSPPRSQLIERFPLTSEGEYTGSTLNYSPNTVELIKEPYEMFSGFIRFRPQSVDEVSTAVHQLASPISIASYCALNFEIRPSLVDPDSIELREGSLWAVLRQDRASYDVAFGKRVPNLAAVHWQTVKVPIQDFVQKGLDVSLPVSAVGYRFELPAGNTIDIDDIGFGPC
jgi:hypothetical protein